MEVFSPRFLVHLFILCRELVEGIQHHLCISLGLRISSLKDLVEKEITSRELTYPPKMAF